MQDAGESPIEGVEVRLLNSAGNPVYDSAGAPMITYTSATGLYSFLGLPADTYFVKFTAPENTQFTLRDSTTDDKDSDADTTAGTTYGQTASITIGGGQKYYDADAGLVLINPTLAVVSAFDAYTLGSKVVVSWVTASESNTAGFDVERLDAVTGEWVTVNEHLVPGLYGSPDGGTYAVVDKIAEAGKPYSYRLVEVETSGSTLIHGPYDITPTEKFKRGKAYDEIAAGNAVARVAKTLRSGRGMTLSALGGGWTRPSPTRADRLRVEISKSGLYKITVGDLVTGLRLTEARAQQLIRAEGLSLSSNGDQIAYLPAADGTALYFYAGSIDSIYTANNVYWLAVGKGTLMVPTAADKTVDVASTTTTQAEIVTASEGTTTTEVEPAEEPTSTTAESATTSTAAPAETTTSLPQAKPAVASFIENSHFEKDLTDMPALFHDPEADIWLWEYVVAGYPSLSSKTLPITAASVVLGKSLEVHLQGMVTTGVANEHSVRVSLNGSVLGETRWTGAVPHSVRFDLPEGLLRSGDNQVTLEALLRGGVPYSMVAIDSVDVAYERALEAVGDQLFFSTESQGSALVSGLSSTSAWILDLKDANHPVLVAPTESGGVAGASWVEFESEGSKYLVATAEGAMRPVGITGAVAPGLRAKNKGADYIVITSPSLATAAQQLATYRARDGFKTLVVTTSEIYDEFNYGVPSPLAIKRFIEYAAVHYRPVASFVVLAGEGTYDYKNNFGAGDSLVPSVLVDSESGLVSSDVSLADYRGGDGVPEVAIGRIPAMDSAELAAAIAKIKAYESASTSGRNKVLFTADNPDSGGDFAADSDALAGAIPGTVAVEKAYFDGSNLAAVRSKTLASFSDGTLLVNYMGHGSVAQLASESIVSSADVSGLGANSRLPIVTALTCVVGQYGLPGYDSLSEAMAMRAGAGAIAVWAPTALEENAESAQLGALFLQNLFGGSKVVRLGSVVQATLQAGADKAVSARTLTTYNLLGDPALRVSP